MAKEPIPSNFLTDTIRFLLRWGLRLIALLVAIIVLIVSGVGIVDKYDARNKELVILVVLKCGPTKIDTKDYPENRFISLRGTRKSEVISKLVEIRPKSYVMGDSYSGWNESYGFEHKPRDILTTRDKYFYKEILDDGSVNKVSFDRKTLQRIVTRTKDGVQTAQSFRECKEISVRKYNAELESVKKAFSEGNKI